jgi:hypothetical protein
MIKIFFEMKKDCAYVGLSEPHCLSDKLCVELIPPQGNNNGGNNRDQASHAGTGVPEGFCK